MDTKNKMVGLLLGIIIGIAWLYTEPNADITNTMGKEFALTEPQQINYLELKDIKPIITLNEEIYALQQTKTKEIIVSTNNTFHFLSGNIPSIPAQITPTSFQAQRFNGKINFLYCGTKQTTNSEQVPGLYYYDATHEITEILLTRVPLHNIPRRKELRVVSWEEEAFPVENFNETNSRPIYSCGAVVPSLDGNRIYFSENSAYPTASLETAWMEDISIPPASFIWMYEKSSKTVQLIGRNFTSVSSILLEYNHNETSKSRRPHRDRESSLLLSESSIYQISRLYLREIEGKNRSEIVHSQLSGMSGTLERDSNRNIWVSVGPQRTSLLNYIFSSKRLIKKGVLRLPTDYYYDSLFEGNSTIVQISPDGQSILAYYSTPFSSKFSLFPLGNDELLIGESSAQNVTNIFSVSVHTP